MPKTYWENLESKCSTAIGFTYWRVPQSEITALNLFSDK